MAHYCGPKCRKCRYLGVSVCGSERCALQRRETRPGMHPEVRRGTPKEYKIRLLEKQKLRFAYWVSERQLRGYVKRAFGKRGVTGENLLKSLEQRLETVVYRVGFAPTMPAARQVVVHGHVTVNGLKVNRPSYQVKPGDLVSLREKSMNKLFVKDGLARREARPGLPYLQVDPESLQARLLATPARDEIPVDIDDRLVTEYYTRLL